MVRPMMFLKLDLKRLTVFLKHDLKVKEKKVGCRRRFLEKNKRWLTVVGNGGKADVVLLMFL